METWQLGIVGLLVVMIVVLVVFRQRQKNTPKKP